jgi:hypothetical protein
MSKRPHTCPSITLLSLLKLRNTQPDDLLLLDCIKEDKKNDSSFRKESDQGFVESPKPTKNPAAATTLLVLQIKYKDPPAHKQTPSKIQPEKKRENGQKRTNRQCLRRSDCSA